MRKYLQNVFFKRQRSNLWHQEKYITTQLGKRDLVFFYSKSVKAHILIRFMNLRSSYMALGSCPISVKSAAEKDYGRQNLQKKLA